MKKRPIINIEIGCWREICYEMHMIHKIHRIDKSSPGESKPMTGQVNVKQLINRTPNNIWRHRPKAIQCRNNQENTMITYYTRYGNPEKRRHNIM